MTASLPSIPLNHFYLTLDSATYTAIEQNPFLRREFARTEQRTTIRTDVSYTGLYFYGTKTYFEFFDVARQSPGKPGDSAIAFGVDQAGGLEAVKTSLASEFSILEAPITRPFNGQQFPWFYMAVPQNFPSESSLRIWIMEYHPEFLKVWNPPSDGVDRGMSRRAILERYAELLKDVPSRPYFKDIVSITVAVDDATRQRLVEICELLGYNSRVTATMTVLEGIDIELRLIDQQAEVRGVREITLTLDRKPDAATEMYFGARSVLKLGADGFARWTF